MDNITHTLIGVALGNSVKGSLNESSEKFKKAALWTAIIGNNIPDCDFVLRAITDKEFGYLLQHRGFTHTVALALVLGLVSAQIGVWIANRGRTFAGWKLYILGVVSVLFHIGADFCNNYGVHPFSPWFNRWYYGDFIFIVEPLVIFAILPYAYFTATTRWARRITLSLGFILSAVVISQLFTPGFVSLFVGIWAIGQVLLQKRWRSLFASAGSVLGVLFIFGLGSNLARQKALRLIQESNGSLARIVQMSTSPAPANPFCWSTTALTIENDNTPPNSAVYIARSGVISLLPALFSAKDCYPKMGSIQEGVLVSSNARTENGTYWKGEFRRPLSEFEDLQRNNCFFQAFLEFSRIPVWYVDNGRLVAEDLRYSRSGSNSFTKTDLSTKRDCPKRLPHWEPPTLTAYSN